MVNKGANYENCYLFFIRRYCITLGNLGYLFANYGHTRDIKIIIQKAKKELMRIFYTEIPWLQSRGIRSKLLCTFYVHLATCKMGRKTRLWRCLAATAAQAAAAAGSLLSFTSLKRGTFE